MHTYGFFLIGSYKNDNEKMIHLETRLIKHIRTLVKNKTLNIKVFLCSLQILSVIKLTH